MEENKLVNRRELEDIEKMEKKGWKTVANGKPDLLFIKVKDGKIIDCCFDEVKSPKDKLSYDQFIWKECLEMLGAKFEVKVIE